MTREKPVLKQVQTRFHPLTPLFSIRLEGIWRKYFARYVKFISQITWAEGTAVHTRPILAALPGVQAAFIGRRKRAELRLTKGVTAASVRGPFAYRSQPRTLRTALRR